MALTMYMSLTGKTQGDIKGGCIQSHDSKKDKILVYQCEQETTIPKNPHDGLPTGQRIHNPLTVVKGLDVASPKIFQAVCSGERFSNVTLDFWRITAEGIEEHYYTIQLEDAIIVNRKAHTPLTFHPDNQAYMDMEEVSFSYSKIIHTYNDGNISAEDSWV
ncbi:MULTISPECIES: type VI secretion system tube protein TssD [Grimontia]|uniref:type VI secretion system tube protein TssD n=1 Tax=Grimontia TaxID=246861 RepID=UPI000587D1FF|nr:MULTISPECIES: type VI secretion system tube protein TssD [Grimontia]WRV97766.1 type VI secretion system tube protein TssD [Grimontia sp. NTOU-MAR1]